MKKNFVVENCVCDIIVSINADRVKFFHGKEVVSSET